MSVGISDDLSSPLYLGGSITLDVPGGAPVAIAGHTYQIDPKQYQRATLEVLRGSADVGASPGEQSLNTHGLWRRTAKDWRLGAGQTYFDDDTSETTRFFSSKGIDAWTARQASLLNDTELKRASANTNLEVVPVGAFTYLVDGAVLRFTSDPTPASPTWSATGAAPASVLSFTSDGSSIWLGCGGTNPIQKVAAGSTSAPTAFGTFQAQLVGYANGRLLAAKANRLVEVDSSGGFGAAGQLDYSHPNTSFVWKGIVGTPSAVYVWGDAGGTSEVYSIVPDPSNGQLRPPTWAWTVPPSETVLSMVWASAVMLVGTNLGLRVARQGSTNVLTNGAAIEVPGGVGAIFPDRSYAWFSWSNYDATSTGLGRINLAMFVDPDNLVPAFASDLMVAVQGVVGSVASIGGRRYFTVSGSGLWGQNADLVPQGVMDSGWLTFSTIERKVVVSVDLRHEALAGSISLALATGADPYTGGSWVGLSTSNIAGTLGPGSPYSAANTGFERMKVQVTLNRAAGDATQGPVLRRWTARAIATPYRTDEIVVPIRLFTEVETFTPHGEPGVAWQDVLGEYLYLKSLEANGSIVVYQEGTSSYSCFIDAVELKPAKLADGGEFFETLMLVHLLTVNSIS